MFAFFDSIQKIYKENKFVFRIPLILGLVIFLIPTLLYILRFLCDDQYSIYVSTPADWGVFGDFIGGILNPVIAIANTVILIYISYTAHKLNENISDKDNKTQKFIILTQMRYDSYSNFKKSLPTHTDLIILIENNNKSEDGINRIISELIILRGILETFQSNSNILFEELIESTPDFSVNINECISHIAEIIKLNRSLASLFQKNVNNPNIIHNLNCIQEIKNYVHYKDLLIGLIDKYLIKTLN